MKEINLRKDAPNQVTTFNPQPVAEAIQKLVDVRNEIQNQQAKLKELESKESYISGVTIPDLMAELKLKTCKLEDGSEVSVGNKYFASMKADKKPECINWLRNNGMGDIVKNEITVRFGRNEDDKARQYIDLARGQKYEPEQKVSVHASTLRLTLEDFQSRGGKIPPEFFNTFEKNQTKITNKPKD
tara:strand:+ start:1679 stop:2236 length:558 start_codon:yes stop_codon:yes gene_type:complete